MIKILIRWSSGNKKLSKHKWTPKFPKNYFSGRSGKFSDGWSRTSQNLFLPKELFREYFPSQMI